MLKIATIIGTRPEIIKLSALIKKIDLVFDQDIIHTGQNYDYDLNQIFFKDLNIRKPNFFLNSARKNTNQTISKIINNLDTILSKINPDACIILGDTNSALASALTCKKKKIEIFHLEGGNRSFDHRTPEEMNRKIIDHISDINFVYSNLSKNYLIQEGLSGDRVVKIGSPMKEIININFKKIASSQILKKLKIKKNNFFLFSLHREENVDSRENLIKFFDILHYIKKKFNKKIIVSAHPRIKLKIEEFKLNSKFSDFAFHKPFSFSEYINLQKNAFLVLSDSGTITEEASILGIDAINLRYSHERPEGMECGTAIFTGLNLDKIIDSIKFLKKISKKNNIIPDYNIDNFSDILIKNIISYYNYDINKKI